MFSLKQHIANLTNRNYSQTAEGNTVQSFKRDVQNLFEFQISNNKYQSTNVQHV